MDLIWNPGSMEDMIPTFHLVSPKYLRGETRGERS